MQLLSTYIGVKLGSNSLNVGNIYLCLLILPIFRVTLSYFKFETEHCRAFLFTLVKHLQLLFFDMSLKLRLVDQKMFKTAG